jgi:hypothetical protein
VYAVEELVKSVPSDAGLDVHFNLQLAIKGIITEPKPPKAKLKPELKMERDLAYELMSFF